MWVKRGTQRLWISKHRDFGLVVYDPDRSEASPPDVLLFIHNKGAFKTFRRLPLRARGLWTCPDSLDVAAAMKRYARLGTSVNDRTNERVNPDETEFLEPCYEFDPRTRLIMEVKDTDPQDAIRAEWWSDVLEFNAYLRGEDPADEV